MLELRWYLEKFLDYPFYPETLHAEKVLSALKTWGTNAFRALFALSGGEDLLNASEDIEIQSQDPAILSWPWETLYDPNSNTYLAHRHRVTRSILNLSAMLPVQTPALNRINILLVIARPYIADVRYRSIARPLLDMLHVNDLPVYMDVLRPPTFERLRSRLQERPGYYHILHFDGHGVYRQGQGESSSPQDHLIFENEAGYDDPKTAREIANLTREHAVPVVVLNACQSATLDTNADHAFSSVATALLQVGVRSVVAMAYSLYVSGAQVFLPAFYLQLLKDGRVSEAVRVGRESMARQSERRSSRGPYPLQDWLLPVLYEQAPFNFNFELTGKSASLDSHLPPTASSNHNEHALVGRDGPILSLDRALSRKTSCVLLQGLVGIGKTALARGFMQWLSETGGLDSELWFDFREIRTFDEILNPIGSALLGDTFTESTTRLASILEILKRRRLIMVWDNFESVHKNLSDEDRLKLLTLLDVMEGTLGQVIITSRLSEKWLRPARRLHFRLWGFEGEEQWEYCELVLHEFEIEVNRDDEQLTTLIDYLGGHPLALRVILPKLRRMTASTIYQSLRNDIRDLYLSQEEWGLLFRDLRSARDSLALELLPLLPLVTLHEAFLNTSIFQSMAQKHDQGWTPNQIDRLLTAFANFGIIIRINDSIFSLYRLLPCYLRSIVHIPETCERAFAETLAEIATLVLLQQKQAFGEPRNVFELMLGNFYVALNISEKLKLAKSRSALTQSLALHALHKRKFLEAARLFQLMGQDIVVNEDFEAASYHNLGVTAQEQSDFKTARGLYRKSLQIAERNSNLKQKAESYYNLAQIALEERNFGEAQEFYEKSLSIKNSYGDQYGIAQVFNGFGRIAEAMQNFDSAYIWYVRSLEISEKLTNLALASSTYHQLGCIFERQNKLDIALDWYQKSLKIKKVQGNQLGMAVTTHQLGRVAAALGDQDCAREYYLQSLEISEAHGYSRVTYGTYQELGTLAVDRREFSMAGEWYAKSLEGFESVEYETGIANVCGSLGLLAALQDRIEESGRWLVKSIRTSRQLGDSRLTDHSLSMFSLIYRNACYEDKQILRAIWLESSMGSFPDRVSQ